MKIRSFGLSDRGRLRPHNEDSMLVEPERGLYAVADGMGGHAAGEVASRLAIEAISETLAEADGDDEAIRDLLRRAMIEANERIASVIRQCPEFRGMGTTVVVALTRGARLWVANVGDSRAYLVREGRIHQLTTDHSLVNELVRLGMISREQAARDPRRNVVTRALGSGNVVAPDVVDDVFRAGDVLILCSDGLNSMVSDQAILEIVRDEGSDLESCCKRLIAAANDAGGEDNVTVVLVAPAGEEADTESLPDRVAAPDEAADPDTD